jgi:hypothetical protein
MHGANRTFEENGNVRPSGQSLFSALARPDLRLAA